MENMVKMSVIMPAYNEAENIESVVKKCFSTLETLKVNGEVIVTDDGSKDRTLEILRALQKEYPNLNVVVHETNQGYGAALKSAADAAKGEYIVSIDSDGQFDVSESSKLIEEYKKGYDVVTGYRKKKQDSLFRVVADRGLNMLVKLLFGVSFRDTNCALKLYGPGVLSRISIEARGYQAPTEILMKLHSTGHKIGQVGISHFAREKGKSALNPFVTSYKMFIFLIYLRLKIHLFKTRVIPKL